MNRSFIQIDINTDSKMTRQRTVESTRVILLLRSLFIILHRPRNISFDTNPVLKAKPKIRLRARMAVGSGQSVTIYSSDDVFLKAMAKLETETIVALSVGIILVR
jgi:hypothetical protein